MDNPWKINPKALNVFFTDKVEITVKHNGQTITKTIDTCTFPLDDTDPFDDNSVESKIKQIVVLIMPDTWTFAVKPSIGNIITLEDFTGWKVCNFENENGLYKLEARNI